MNRSIKSTMAVVGILATLFNGVIPAKEEMNLDYVSPKIDAETTTNESLVSRVDEDDATDSNNLTTVIDNSDSVGNETNNETDASRRSNSDDDEFANIPNFENDEDDASSSVNEITENDSNGTVDDPSDLSNDTISPATNATLGNDTMEVPSNETSENGISIPSTLPPPTAPPFVYVDPAEFQTDDLDSLCPLRRRQTDGGSSSVKCSDLPVTCFNCTYDYACTYGARTLVSCTTDVDCVGEKTIEREMTCQYCFQTKFGVEHVCTLRNGPGDGVHPGCSVKKSPSSQSRFKGNCTVRPQVLCLGRRSFHKMLPCNWTSGYRWTTSLLLSIFLGGFGADRFYLGQWREGIGKLFSFGGLGVWTLIDVILISIGYIGPQDGSLYIY